MQRPEQSLAGKQILRQSDFEERRRGGTSAQMPQPAALWSRSTFQFLPSRITANLSLLSFKVNVRCFRNPALTLPSKGSTSVLTKLVILQVPKTRRTYCKGKECKKHTQHKVTQYKAGKVRTQHTPLHTFPFAFLEYHLPTYLPTSIHTHKRTPTPLTLPLPTLPSPPSPTKNHH